MATRSDFPENGAQVNRQLGSGFECPYADNRPASFLQGWHSFATGGVETTSDPEIDTKLYARGYQAAKSYKSAFEAYVWTLTAMEQEGDQWVAVLTRTEPRSLDDVYNGTGTGLGTVTVTERVNVSPVEVAHRS